MKPLYRLQYLQSYDKNTPVFVLYFKYAGANRKVFSDLKRTVGLQSP